MLSPNGHNLSVEVRMDTGVTIHDGPLTAGPRVFTWQGTNASGRHVASGVYLVELRAPDGVMRQKVNLLK